MVHESNAWKKNALRVSVLRHMNIVHALLFHLINIHFNIILPSKQVSSKWSPSF